MMIHVGRILQWLGDAAITIAVCLFVAAGLAAVVFGVMDIARRLMP